MTDDPVSTVRPVIPSPRSHFRSIDAIDEGGLGLVNFTEVLSFADGSRVPPELMTQVGVEWNERSLFVYFRGRFETLRSATNLSPEMLQKKTYRLWEVSDVYEVFIGPKAVRNRMYKEFQAAPDNRWIDIDVFNALGTSNHHWYSGCRMKSFVDNEMKIWSAVFELPWNCFGASYDTEPDWNVNFYRATGKFHGDELLAWSPVGTGEKCFHRPQHFGRIQFLFD